MLQTACDYTLAANALLQRLVNKRAVTQGWVQLLEALPRCSEPTSFSRKYAWMDVPKTCRNRCNKWVHILWPSAPLFVGLGEGVAPTALRAFHQLIVKRTAVAEVRDRGKSDGAETKTFTCNFLYSSHPRFNKPLDLCFHFKWVICVGFGDGHVSFVPLPNVFYAVGEMESFVFSPKGEKLLFMAGVVCRHPKVNTWSFFQD